MIISEKTKDTIGDYLEVLGTYDPHTNKANLKTDRIQYWISKGAQASGVIHNLLISHKIITGDKIKVANIKKKEGEEKPVAETPKAAEPQAETAAPAPETPQPKTDTPEAGKTETPAA